MLREMSSAQFAEWMAFAELEPFGGLREDYRAGLLMAVVANCAPFRGKGARVWNPWDFFRTLRRPEQTPRQIAAVAEAITAGMGGRRMTAAEFNATIGRARARA